MKKLYEVKETDHNENLFIACSLVAISMVIVVQLITLAKLSTSLQVSLYCFSISIPFLCTSIAGIYVEKHHIVRPSVWYMRMCIFFGLLLSLIGIGAIFYNFNILIGIIFTVSSIIGFLVVATYNTVTEKINNEIESNQTAGNRR